MVVDAERARLVDLVRGAGVEADIAVYRSYQPLGRRDDLHVAAGILDRADIVLIPAIDAAHVEGAATQAQPADLVLGPKRRALSPHLRDLTAGVDRRNRHRRHRPPTVRCNRARGQTPIDNLRLDSARHDEASSPRTTSHLTPAHSPQNTLR